MPVTDTKEKGLESLIVQWLVDCNGYEQGVNEDYNRKYAVDETRLFRFLSETQADEMEKLNVFSSNLEKEKFLDRLRSEITKRGVIDVLRNGVKIYPADLIMFYATPSKKNEKAGEMFKKNIFSVTRQLMYSNDVTRLALDLCIFINGLPVITCELKNQLTKQDVDDAVLQYQRDRDPKELLFQFKRCMTHFAVDDVRVKFCTKLDKKDSWFLPFDKGYNDGAGNPPNPDGLMTDYLWKEILNKPKLARIIENYAQVVEGIVPDTKKKISKQIFPRYHQLSVVEKLLADVREKGIGQRYLIQHSAGSGKSNSIAWLAHQLVGLEDAEGNTIVDSVIVVTDRVILDKQIRDTIRQFAQVSNIVAWAEYSKDLREDISGGKKIIISTVHKFPVILDTIGNEHKGRKFAIIIDEAHSSQSGSMSAQMNMALSGEFTRANHEDDEDRINRLIEERIKGRKMLKNASYFAFTATPKNKTLEVFGAPYVEGDQTKHRPFHSYTMKQAIQEGFILDVLKHYTPVSSYYRLMKTAENDPMFDKKKAQKKLRYFVEDNSYTISQKAELMVEHFHGQVVAKNKIENKARAMVVTNSIKRCIEYYYAINKCLENRHSPYKTVIAFSGEHEFVKDAPALTSAGLNRFADNKIEKKFRTDPYRFLIVADMFQTGYDEPLLHTMYVDKMLSDIKAVQTLSRLNRSCPKKYDTFVLDFANEADVIAEAFSNYYRTTILSSETDPNMLYDIDETLSSLQVYTKENVKELVLKFLSGAGRDTLDPILDACVVLYNALNNDDKIKFKGTAKSFVRIYGFLGAILPYGVSAWEELSIFLNLLIPKLPSPPEDDLSVGILEAIDLDSYRIEAREAISLSLKDGDAEVDPVPVGRAGGRPDPEIDSLSSILADFNDMFGNINWKNADNVRRQISQIPLMVSRDEKYKNAMKNSDKQNAHTESQKALKQVMLDLMADNMELFKQYQDNPSFKKWLSSSVFAVTYNKEGKSFEEM